MLFTAGLKLLNLHLTYLRVILRIELLKFHPKRSEFVKSGGFSILKFSIVVLTGFTTLVNSFYTLIFTRLGKVETLFVALFAIGLSLASIFAIYLLHYLDDFKFLLSTLQRLDYAFGRHFSGKLIQLKNWVNLKSRSSRFLTPGFQVICFSSHLIRLHCLISTHKTGLIDTNLV